jgi:2-iminobutanoate/2-iminopropanoate deaminase
MTTKKSVFTKNAPKPVGPYSQAVGVIDMTFYETVYISGQIALEPQTGEMRNTSLEEEAQQVFANLSAVLEAAGASVHNVARVDIFMTDISQFGKVNELYAQWLEGVEVMPARQTVEVSALPKGASLEVSCIACV